MKYFIKIYGCQYNVWDAARIDFMLKKIGLMPSDEKEAEIIFILSCSVRKSAVDRIMGMVKNWQGKKVVITGCVLPNDKPKYLKKNVVLWDSKKPEDLARVLFEDEKSENFSHHSKNIKKIMFEGNSSSAYLPIMIGCNNFCSYCAVPYTRGREESRPFDEIVSDFKKMVEKGYEEIMLLGQNVNSYRIQNTDNRIQQNKAVISTQADRSAGEKSHHGVVIPAEAGIQKNTILDPRVQACLPAGRPEDDKSHFALLLKALNDIFGDFVIRFTSNHPKDMTDDIIGAVRDLPKVKKEIHLPLQSGSNKILKAMNRPYTKEKYLDIIDKIKKEIPNVELSTDVIVGFPGETEEDFEETVEVFNKIDYHQAFVNKYSPRSGTAAFKLGDPIPWKEKERRWSILNNIANK